MDIRELKAVISGDASGAKKAFEETGASAERMDNQVNKVAERVRGSFDGLAERANHLSNITAGLAIGGFGALITYGFNATRQVQDYVAGIKSLTGSTQEASDVIKHMIDYVQGKPFDRIEVLGATKQLLAFGRTAQDTFSDIDLLGKAVIVSGRSWSDLANVYGQVMASGKLLKMQFDEINGSGVGLGKALQHVMNTDMQGVLDKMSAGEITAADFHQAMAEALPDSLIANSSNTINNKLLTLKTSFRNLAFEVLGVDFSRITDGGMPLVKPGGLLDSMVKMMTNLTNTMKRKDIQQAFIDIGKALNEGVTKYLPTIIQGFGWILTHIPEIIAGFITFKSVIIGLRLADFMRDVTGVADSFSTVGGSARSAGGEIEKTGGKWSTLKAGAKGSVGFALDTIALAGASLAIQDVIKNWGAVKKAVEGQPLKINADSSGFHKTIAGVFNSWNDYWAKVGAKSQENNQKHAENEAGDLDHWGNIVRKHLDTVAGDWTTFYGGLTTQTEISMQSAADIVAGKAELIHLNLETAFKNIPLIMGNYSAQGVQLLAENLQHAAHDGEIQGAAITQAIQRGLNSVQLTAPPVQGPTAGAVPGVVQAHALGGVIHRALGGLVGHFAAGFPGMAQGTDTIPAWLTEGEGVLSKDAMSKIGVENFNKLNKGQLPVVPVPGGGSDTHFHIHIDNIGGIEERQTALKIWRALTREARAHGVTLPQIGAVVQ